MNKIAISIFTALLMFSTLSDAAVSSFRGGSYSGGSSFSRGGSYSGSSRSFSTPSSPSRPTQTYSTPRSSTTTTTTTTRRSSSGYYGGYGYGGGYMPFGGFGMGYGYTNGILTGLIIGNLMHPTGTVMYSGPGNYSNNSLLYPDGRVVDQSGHVVGTYMNGVFTPIINGGMAAQPVPSDAVPPQVSQPVVVHESNNLVEALEAFVLIIGIIILVFCIVFILARGW